MFEYVRVFSFSCCPARRTAQKKRGSARTSTVSEEKKTSRVLRFFLLPSFESARFIDLHSNILDCIEMSTSYGGRTAEQHGLLNIPDELVGLLCEFLGTKCFLKLSLCVKKHNIIIPVRSVKRFQIVPGSQLRDGGKFLESYLQRFDFVGIQRISFGISLERCSLQECERIAELLLPHLAEECRFTAVLSMAQVLALSSHAFSEYARAAELLKMVDVLRVEPPIPSVAEHGHGGPHARSRSFREVFPNAGPRSIFHVLLCNCSMYPDPGVGCLARLHGEFMSSAISLGLANARHCVALSQLTAQVTTNTFKGLAAAPTLLGEYCANNGSYLHGDATARVLRAAFLLYSPTQFKEFWIACASFRNLFDVNTRACSAFLKRKFDEHSPESPEGIEWLDVFKCVIAFSALTSHNSAISFQVLFFGLSGEWCKLCIDVAADLLQESASHARESAWQNKKWFKSTLRLFVHLASRATVLTFFDIYLPQFPYEILNDLEFATRKIAAKFAERGPEFHVYDLTKEILL